MEHILNRSVVNKRNRKAVFKSNITVLYLCMGFALVYGRNKERFFLVFARPGYLTSRKDRFVYAVLDKFVIAVSVLAFKKLLQK